MQVLRDQLALLNGADFLQQIEDEPAFQAARGPEFEAKFLKHPYPAIVRMAGLRQLIVTEEDELGQLRHSLEQIQQHPTAMMYGTFELPT